MVDKSNNTKPVELDLSWGKSLGLLASMLGFGLIVGFCLYRWEMLFSLLAMAGAIAGWLLGVLVMPFDEREEKSFGVFIKVISGFVTGYLLSKFDPLLTWLLTTDRITGLAPIGREDVAGNVLITLCSFGMSLLTVYSTRAYWSDSPGPAGGTSAASNPPG